MSLLRRTQGTAAARSDPTRPSTARVTRTRPKGRDKAAEQKEWEANDAQWMAFQQIFGPDGDETVAAKVLLDYSAQFPRLQAKREAAWQHGSDRLLQVRGHQGGEWQVEGSAASRLGAVLREDGQQARLDSAEGGLELPETAET